MWAFAKADMEPGCMAELTRHLPQPPPDKANAKSEIQKQMISDYADFMTKTQPAAVVVDEAVLPHPKYELLEALLNAIAFTPDKEAVRCLGIAAISLADYQPGVGSNPSPISTWQQIIEANTKDGSLSRLAKEAESASKFGAIKIAEMKVILKMIQAAKNWNLRIQPFHIRAWMHIKSYLPFRRYY